MEIVEKNIYIEVIAAQIMMIGALNLITLKKVDILNEKYLELRKTFREFKKIKNKL